MKWVGQLGLAPFREELRQIQRIRHKHPKPSESFTRNDCLTTQAEKKSKDVQGFRLFLGLKPNLFTCSDSAGLTQGRPLPKSERTRGDVTPVADILLNFFFEK